MATDSFFQLKAWIRTGVSPRGAHVRRTGGRCETPLSSWKTMSTVAHGEPLGVAHMEPVWQRDRIPDTKMVVVLLGGVGAASAARGELLLGVLGAEALTGDLDEVRPHAGSRCLLVKPVFRVHQSRTAPRRGRGTATTRIDASSSLPAR